MSLSVRSFAKINLGLRIGPRRPDGFHDLLTLYQTIDSHDVLHLSLTDTPGIEIRCRDPRVPTDHGNTCWRVAAQVLAAAGSNQGVRIEIEKRLPVQGGLGAASSNAVATMMGLEKLLGAALAGEQRHRIAAGVGSDLPLFLLGGTVLGEGRGELVRELPDLPSFALVVVTPEVSVSTPKAFADWDGWIASRAESSPDPFGLKQAAIKSAEWPPSESKLTPGDLMTNIEVFRLTLERWLEDQGIASGVPALVTKVGGDRVEGSASWAQSLLGLVRTGIENDFEQVVFPQYPELSELKRALYEEGAQFASLSGSGSVLYGLFDYASLAKRAARNLQDRGVSARAARFLGREEYKSDLRIG